LAPNNLIYSLPQSGQQVLRLDPSNDTISEFDGAFPNGIATGSVLAPNGKIYSCPRSVNQVLVVDSKLEN
jgi:hypothetical protein